MSRSPKSLLLVSANFPPVSTSGVHRMIRLVRYLTDLGVKIVVLTAKEKTLAKRFKYDPDLVKKVPSQVEVVRVPAIQGLKKILDFKNKMANPKRTHENKNSQKERHLEKEIEPRKQRLMQMLKDAVTLNLNSPDNFAFWIYPAVKTGLQLIRKYEIQNIFSSSPPGSAHVVAYYLKKRTQMNWIADFRDPWAKKQWTNPEMTAFKRRMNIRFEEKTLQTADRIIMNTPEMLEIYKKDFRELITPKGVVIPNGFDPADFRHLPEAHPGQGKTITLAHTGTLYRGRSPMPFLEGWGRAIRSGNLARNRLMVKFIGSVGLFKAEIDAAVRTYQLQNHLQIIPTMPHHQCLLEMNQADVLLLLQPGTQIQIPAKFYEYLAIRKPIFAISAPGVIRRMLEEYHLGWWADAENIEQIANQLQQMDTFLNGENGQWQPNEDLIARFDGQKLVDKIYDLLE